MEERVLYKLAALEKRGQNHCDDSVEQGRDAVGLKCSQGALNQDSRWRKSKGVTLQI